jgi:CO/xanthine dehydrogenase Mo-binding subunit
MEIAERDLELVAGGVLRPRGQPSGGLPLAELASEAFHRYEPEGGSHILSGANVAQVLLDPLSGAVKLLRYAVAYEVGRAINPLTIQGQISGAAAQGISGTLFEEFAYTAEGQPISTSFMDYMQATATEIPEIDVLVLEFGEPVEDDPVAGAKGAGEGGIIATAATVAAAVEDAVGRRGSPLAALPLTPERVQRLVAEGQRASGPIPGPVRGVADQR